MIRRAAVAGLFYEGTQERLRAQVRDLVRGDRPKARAVAVVVPHAGYIYSGKVAGAVYASVAMPGTCVIVGPNHTGLGAGAAIMSDGSWETPLGQVAIDADLAKAIKGHSSILEEDHRAHQREHSIEVQLPLLQALEVPFSFVPICLFSDELAACQDVGLAVAEGVSRAGRPVLLVASTDMSHYLDRDRATRLDREAIDAIIAMDPHRLHRLVRAKRMTMCGYHATTAVLIAARRLGATRAELVAYATSGDVTRDDTSVVGYAGLIIA